ncbi:MAG: sugar translocase [Candidatus Saccharibacteria bacterium]|nr:sugar translocase [Candidatus Saccharibacteria bacterium]
MTEQKLSKKSHFENIKQLARRVTKFEKIRFILVGGLNTTVDFIILLILASLFSVPVSIANIISTSVALLVSYALNKKVVFGNTDTNNRRQFMLFVAITLFGLWVLQTIIIAFVSTVLSGWLAVVSTSALVLTIAKLLATCISLTWNYLWYSKVVFSQKKPTNQ